MSSNRCSLDWLQFTFHSVHEKDIDFDFNILLHDFAVEFPAIHHDMLSCGVQRERGKFNYNCVFDVASLYQVCFHSQRPDMGVHCIFPSSAIPHLISLFNIPVVDNPDFALASQIFDYFSIVTGRIVFTRIDVAFDDFDRVYTPADYIKFQFENRIRSKCHCSQMNFSALQTADTGSTWYLGKRGQPRYLRVYDKEYQSRGKIKSIRYELELRDHYAASLVAEILANSSTVDFYSLISDMFVVLDKLPFNGHSSAAIRVAKNQATVNTLWSTIFETQVSRRVKVVVPRKRDITTYSKFYYYFERQSRINKIALNVLGIDNFLHVVNSARFKPGDELLIDNYILQMKELIKE